jgi:hypothetical protein
MNEIEKNKPEKQLIIFDHIFLNSTKYRYCRRKVAEALRRVRDWMSRTLRQDEQIPHEYKNMGDHNINQNEQEQKLWPMKFHI